MILDLPRTSNNSTGETTSSGSALVGTRVYLRLSGDDGTAEVDNINKPFLTAQAAFDAATALVPTAQLPAIIDVGDAGGGDFGDVVLGGNFGENVIFRGLGANSKIGNVTANGGDGFSGGVNWVFSGDDGGAASNAHNITLTSNGTVTFGSIYSMGGNGGAGGNGDTSYWDNSVPFMGGDGGAGGNGGTIVLSGVTVYIVNAGGGSGGSGGAAYISNNMIVTPDHKANGGAGGSAGSVTLVNVVFTEVDTLGGTGGSSGLLSWAYGNNIDGYGQGAGGSGGSIIATSSSGAVLDSSGGGSGSSGASMFAPSGRTLGGAAGAITLNDGTTVSAGCNAIGGSMVVGGVEASNMGGAGGTITIDATSSCASTTVTGGIGYPSSANDGAAGVVQ